VGRSASDIFLRTFLRSSAVLLGVIGATFVATSDWTPARDVSTPVTAQKLTTEALVANLSAADPAQRARAACELRKHVEDATAALGTLVALLEDGAPVQGEACRRRWGRAMDGGRDVTTPGQEAAATLVAIGQRAVSPLLAALDNPSWVARRNGAWALGALDEPRAVEPVTRLMNDPEPAVREQAAWVLGVLDDTLAAPAIIRALKDADPRVRRQAAWAAGVMEARGATEPLMAMLEDPDAGVRRQAAWALGIIAR
jgi:HEAT repeat protein